MLKHFIPPFIFLFSIPVNYPSQSQHMYFLVQKRLMHFNIIDRWHGGCIQAALHINGQTVLQGYNAIIIHREVNIGPKHIRKGILNQWSWERNFISTFKHTHI